MTKNHETATEAGGLRTLFISAWLLTVVAIVGVITNQDHFFSVDNQRVALLEKKVGPVQSRSEGLVRWQETVERQGLFDGDRVATGRGGAARIGFGAGRALDLGEDTQIQVTAIMTRDQDPAFMVTLLRGTMIAAIESKCKDCPPIVVRAGDDTYRVGVGARVGVTKALGRKAKKFKPKGPWPGARTAPQPVIAAADGAIIPVTTATEPAPPIGIVAPSPTPSPPPAPVAVPQNVVPDLRAPAVGLNLYTVQPLSALGAAQIAFPLVPARGKPLGKWRPVVLISGEGQRQSALHSGMPTDLEIKVPVTKIRGVATATTQGLVKDYRFSVRPGAALLGSRGATYGARKLDLRIRTFGEFGGGPVTVGLDRFQASTEQGPWTAPKTDVPARSAPVVLQLASGSDLTRLMTFVRGAQRVGLQSGGPERGGGVFVVRDKAVVAQLSGPGVTANVIHEVMTRLGADFVFDGNRAAFTDARGSSQAAIANRVDALLSQGKVLYILKRNKLYPVSRDFIKTNAEVAQFVDSQARAVFLEKVTILDYR